MRKGSRPFTSVFCRVGVTRCAFRVGVPLRHASGKVTFDGIIRSRASASTDRSYRSFTCSLMTRLNDERQKGRHGLTAERPSGQSKEVWGRDDDGCWKLEKIAPRVHGERRNRSSSAIIMGLVCSPRQKMEITAADGCDFTR